MSGVPVPIETREGDHELAQAELERAAAQWLKKRAEYGAQMPRRYDIALDLALGEARRAQRRLDEARKRVARAA